ncbi:arsenate reductase (glutaredoxin) [Paraburkholderia sp. A2WS-5]|uniref:arsenate reductase (glutaredoxin) n=1 Tax=unclassified Paraburkholderia TaxID=2615204 RepID=UPI003B75E183
MITIYHNARCSKSRSTCELVSTTYNKANEPVEVVEYLKTPLTVDQLKALHAMLGGPLLDMVRTNEAEYSALGLNVNSATDNQLYEAIASHPVLLQRPIVVRNGRAAIGRPPENIAVLFDRVA